MHAVIGVFVLAIGVGGLLLGKRIDFPKMWRGRWLKKVLSIALSLVLAFFIVQCLFIGWYAIIVE